MTTESDGATEQAINMLLAVAAGLALLTVSLWGPILERAHAWYDD